MFKKKIILILLISLLYQTHSYSKSNSFEKIDSKNLSKYFSGIVASQNENNTKEQAKLAKKDGDEKNKKKTDPKKKEVKTKSKETEKTKTPASKPKKAKKVSKK